MNSFINLDDAVCINLMNNLPGMFYRCHYDKDWTMIFVSTGCLDITGHSSEDFIYKKISYSALIHPEDQDWLWEKCTYNLEHKMPCNNEYRIICNKGRVRWVREYANGIYDENGKLRFIEGFIQEFTAEKNIDVLNNAFNSYQNAINSGSIVSLTDKSGRILYANDLFCQYSKFKRNELIGKTHRVVNSGFHQTSFFTEMWATISSGKIWRGEIKNRAKDGTYYWVDTVISPVFDSQKEIIQFLSIRNVITDKKEQESELKTAYLNLINIEEEERLRFASEIHDGLAQHLVGIRMLLKKYLKTNDKTLEHVYQMVQDTIAECRNITSNTYPKIISEKGLCHSIKNLTDEVGRASDIEISLTCPVEINDPFSNHVQFIIYRIIQESINNTIKHANASKININAYRLDNNFRIELSDNGKGIPDNILNDPKSFVFIKRRISALGGKLTINSRPDEGTTLFISVPL